MKNRPSKISFDQPICIQDTTVLPGEHKKILLTAGKIPSGSSLSIATHIFRSTKPGPCILLLGGIHGDEINGIEIITSLLASDILKKLQSGSVIAIPILNVFGFNNMSRDMPDGKDVNRSFPGNKSGSLASRVAKSLTSQILPYADYAIDLHTGSALRFNYPHTRYTSNDDESKQLADIFSAPFAISQKLISNSFRKVAHELNTKVIVYEAGESLRIDAQAVLKGVSGIINILTYFDMIKETDKLTHQNSVIHLNKTKWIRAIRAGLFSASVSAGEKITEKQLLGYITDPYSLKSYPIITKNQGYIIGINKAAIVNQGDAIFHIGSHDE